MMPMRAIIVGPPSVATRIKASMAACHSAASCSAFGSRVMYVPASLRGRAGDRAAAGLACQNGPTRALTVAHHGDGLFVPIEVGPHVSAFLAARLTDEPRFQVGQSDVIGPSVPADRD
jgi:hypothetical protein